MSDGERTGRTSHSSPERPTGEPSPGAYTGPGAWGPAALWLLGGLFVLSALATVHSILVTFGG